MKIYNLFPLLAGPFGDWAPHLGRAAAMGFDWVFVNPIQQTGRSGSLYSIADYFAIDPRLLDARSSDDPREQVRATTAEAERLGLSMMIDLVINHCAIDSPLVKQHPDWFVREGRKIANPFCVEADGRKVVWEDLAQFDHRSAKARGPLLDYCVEIVTFLASLGFRGFRCDAAYQLPTALWRELIQRTRQTYPDLVFVAETLGCTPEQTLDTAAAGFDAIFNSSKWWDFDSPWLLEQYALTRAMVPSISFPESHDTERLFSETQGNLAAMQQRYLFAGVFSTGVMMPMGFEFGFRRRLSVVETRREHWEEPQIDLCDFITHVNGLKDRYPVLRDEGPLQCLPVENPAILLLHKRATRDRGEALIALNKDTWNRQYLRVPDLYQPLAQRAPLRDVSFEWAMDYLPTPFEFDLAPGMGRVLVTPAETPAAAAAPARKRRGRAAADSLTA